MLHLARQLSRRPQQGAPPLVLAGASGLLQQLLGGAAAGEALQQGGAACGQARQYGKAARPARPAAPAYDDSGSEDESFMSLPEDLDEILALNPRLHHVMTLAREHQR